MSFRTIRNKKEARQERLQPVQYTAIHCWPLLIVTAVIGGVFQLKRRMRVYSRLVAKEQRWLMDVRQEGILSHSVRGLVSLNNLDGS